MSAKFPRGGGAGPFLARSLRRVFFVVLCPEAPEGSTGCGSDFKASQKTGPWLKVSSDRLIDAGNRTCDPRFTRHRLIPYTTAVM